MVIITNDRRLRHLEGEECEKTISCEHRLVYHVEIFRLRRPSLKMTDRIQPRQKNVGVVERGAEISQAEACVT